MNFNSIFSVIAEKMYEIIFEDKYPTFCSTLPISWVKVALVWHISNLQPEHHPFSFPSVPNYFSGISLRRSQKDASD